jgi:hypothetical protein
VPARGFFFEVEGRKIEREKQIKSQKAKIKSQK